MGNRKSPTFLVALLVQLTFLSFVDADNLLYSRSANAENDEIVRAAVLPRSDDHFKRELPSVWEANSITNKSPFGHESNYVFGKNSINYGSCVYLDADSICGEEFSGYPIPLDSTVNITTSDGFNSYIQKYVQDPLYVRDKLSSIYGCTGASEDNAEELLRYQTSLWCARSVQRGFANGCSFNEYYACDDTDITEDSNRINIITDANDDNYPLVLNSTSCDLVVETTTTFFQDSNLCPDTSSMAFTNRNATVSNIKTYCNAATSNSISYSGKVGGSYNETLFCGWNNVDTAVKGCKDVLKTSEKTGDDVNTKNQPLLSLLSSNSLTATRNCCTALKNNPDYSKKFKKGLSAGAIAGIVIGSIAFVIIVIGIIYACIKRKNNNADATNNFYSTNPSTSSSINADKSTTSEKKSFFSKALPASVLGLSAGSWWGKNSKSSKNVTIADPYDNAGNLDWSKQSFQSDTNYFYVNEKGERVPFNGTATRTPTTTTNSSRTSISTTSTGISGTSVDGAMPIVNPRAFAVLHGYNPTMDDEMALKAGQAITLLCKFDDGWGIGCICSCERPGCPGSLNDLTGCKYNGLGLKPLPGCKAKTRGVFPLICGTEFEVSEKDFEEPASFEFDDNKKRDSIVSKKLDAIYTQSKSKVDSLSADHRRSSLTLRPNYSGFIAN